MKNDRLLNFVIAFFLAVILLNLFLPKKDTTITQAGIVFKSMSKSYTIPNLPNLQITNNYENVISINTCDDIKITKDWSVIENIKWTSPDFCKNIIINPKEIKSIEFNPISKLFINVWEYWFTISKDFEKSWKNKEFVANFSQVKKWYINTFLSNIFFAPVYNLFVVIISNIPNHSLWLSIILITIIIRLLVLVPQHKIMVNGRRMQAIQPKIKELQEKYKWDQAKIGMELLALYKKEKVNPMWSCLPLLIQLPVLIVLYWIISWITSASNYYYLYWALSEFRIDIINTNFIWLDLVKQEWKSWLILAILIGSFQWLQIKMSLTFNEKKKTNGKIVEKEKKVDDPISEFMPDPNVMNAFMLWWMPFMLAFSSYFFPAWIWIYWLIWTIFTLIQQRVVNKVKIK